MVTRHVEHGGQHTWYCSRKTGRLPRLFPSTCFHEVDYLGTLRKDRTLCTSTMVLARNYRRHEVHLTIAPSLSSLARRSPIDT